MASGVITLRKEDVVVIATLKRLVEWDRLAHELLFDLAEAVETRLKLEVVVAVALSNSGHNGDVVALGADIVGRRDNRDVDVYGLALVRSPLCKGRKHTMFASDLGLGNNKLQGVRIGSIGDGVVKNANGFKKMSSNARFAGEVRGISQDLLRLCLELQAFTSIVLLLHGRLDTNDLATLVQELVHVGVQHICTAVNGRKTSEALGKLSKTVKWVNIWGLSVSCHGVDIKPDSLNSLICLSLLRDIVVCRV